MSVLIAYPVIPAKRSAERESNSEGRTCGWIPAIRAGALAGMTNLAEMTLGETDHYD